MIICSSKCLISTCSYMIQELQVQTLAESNSRVCSYNPSLQIRLKHKLKLKPQCISGMYLYVFFSRHCSCRPSTWPELYSLIIWIYCLQIVDTANRIKSALFVYGFAQSYQSVVKTGYIEKPNGRYSIIHEYTTIWKFTQSNLSQETAQRTPQNVVFYNRWYLNTGELQWKLSVLLGVS